MVPLPLTKAFAGQPDLDALAPEIRWLGPEVLVNQAEERAWEYGLAVQAIRRWSSHRPGLLLDVGGSGSAFGPRLRALGLPVELVDPQDTTTLEAREGRPAGVILAISTIEHVKDDLGFLAAVGRNLAPEGLAFLTMDGWGKVGPDTAHFYWMRERIYSPIAWRVLAAEALALGLSPWGGVDWTYRGDQLYLGPTGYSFFSLCLRKG